jgi:GntR family transcriptional regulator
LRTRIRRGLTRLSSFTEDMQERGKAVTSQLLDFALKAPPLHVAQQFSLGPEEPLLYIFRLRLADGSPVVINISYIRLPPGISITEKDVRTAVSLWALLERKGLHLIEADRVIEAILASEERATLLNVPVGTALLQVEGMAYTITHIPVEYSQVISSGERYKYSVHLER